MLTQLEEKRQRLEKAQAEADRLWRQREEDARKARTFREQMEKAKENARTKGEAEAKRIVRQAQQQADEISPSWTSCAASSKSSQLPGAQRRQGRRAAQSEPGPGRPAHPRDQPQEPA